jgi:hypothetical protein
MSPPTDDIPSPVDLAVQETTAAHAAALSRLRRALEEEA